MNNDLFISSKVKLPLSLSLQVYQTKENTKIVCYQLYKDSLAC